MHRHHPRAALARTLAIVTLAVGLALAVTAPPSTAETWRATDVGTPSGYSYSADTVIFRGASFTAYTGYAPYFRPRIMRLHENGSPAWSRRLPGDCRGSTYSSRISAIVAYDELHVFSSHETSDGICHAWSSDGVAFQSEYIARGASGSVGIATALWSGQIHVIAQAVDGGVAHTWYDPATGTWMSEKLDGAEVDDDMSPVSQAGIGVYDGQFHAVYMTAAGGLRDRWWDPVGGRWNWTTTFSGVLLSGQHWAGLDVETTYANQLHIVYVGTDDSLRHAFYDPNAARWYDAALSRGEPELASSYSRVQAIVHNGQFHAFYALENLVAIGHVWWSPATGAWLGNELDAGSSEPIAALDVTTDAGTLDVISSVSTSVGLRRLRFG